MSRLTYLFSSSSLSEDVLPEDKFGTAGSDVSKRINYVLTRDFSLVLLMNHVATKPHIPAVVAVEGILDYCIGGDAFTNDMKQYTGWRVRQIVEQLDGQWVKAGVKINNSRYNSASVYRFVTSPFEQLKTDIS